MPIVKYKTTGGKLLTFTGTDAYNVALEEVCRDLTGEPFSALQNKLSGATIVANGIKCFFLLFSKVTTLAAARSAADLGNVSTKLAARTEKYGFKTCPACNTTHTRKVKDCRRCGHEAEIPVEADEEIKEYIRRPLPEMDEEGAEDRIEEGRLLACEPEDEKQKVAATRSMRLRDLEKKAGDGSINPDEAKEMLTIQRENILSEESVDGEVFDTDAPPKEVIYSTDKPAGPDSMDAMIEEDEEEEKEKTENGENNGEKEEVGSSQGKQKQPGERQ